MHGELAEATDDERPDQALDTIDHPAPFAAPSRRRPRPLRSCHLRRRGVRRGGEPRRHDGAPLPLLRTVPVGDDRPGLGELSYRHRELAILRTAAWRRCRYIWEQHARLALRAGITAGEIEKIGAAVDSRAGDGTDRAVMAAVDELLRDATMPPGT